MSLVDRIKIIIDVDANGATGPLGKFRTDLAQADGAMGKFKVAGGAAMGFVKSHATEMAAAGATALAGFALKGVEAFTSMALEAGKFSETAGIAVEDASRLREVAGDLGIKAGAVEGAMTKMNLAIANGKQPTKDFADQIVYAKDGTVDSYNSFINLATAIGKIKDPTDRAKAAQETFGKSYGEISEMMSMSAEELRTKLEGVSEAKVITPEEVDKARRYRDAMDNLKDVVEDLQITLGENLTPILADAAAAIQGASDIADKVTGGSGGLGKLYEWANKIFNPLTQIKDAAGKLKAEFGDGLDGKVSDTAFAIKDLDRTATDAAPKVQQLSKDVRDDRDATIAAKDATRDFTGALLELMGQLNAEDAFATFQEKLMAYRSLGVNPSEQATRDYTRSLGEMITKLEGVPDETKARLITYLNEGDLASVEGYLWKWGQGITVPVRFAGQGSVGFMKAAGGTPPDGSPGGYTLVGEEGPELLELPRGARVTSAPETEARRAGRGSATGASPAPVTSFVDNSVTHITYPAGHSDKDVAAAQRRYRRLQGPT